MKPRWQELRAAVAERPLTRRLTRALLIASLATGGVFALAAAERWHDRTHCWGWTPYKNVEPGYFDRAVELCTEGRQAHRLGPFGLFGPSFEGRAAGRCGSLWAAVEVPPVGSDVLNRGVLERYGFNGVPTATSADRERFMESCIDVRASELRARGSSD
ncbi:MAG: hypothetical protein ACRDZ3_19545 [Acidimicrobiia bacterium]